MNKHDFCAKLKRRALLEDPATQEALAALPPETVEEIRQLMTTADKPGRRETTLGALEAEQRRKTSGRAQMSGWAELWQPSPDSTGSGRLRVDDREALELLWRAWDENLHPRPRSRFGTVRLPLGGADGGAFVCRWSDLRFALRQRLLGRRSVAELAMEMGRTPRQVQQLLADLKLLVRGRAPWVLKRLAERAEAAGWASVPYYRELTPEESASRYRQLTPEERAAARRNGCARAGCGRAIEGRRSNKRYCSPQCAGADRSARLRSRRVEHPRP